MKGVGIDIVDNERVMNNLDKLKKMILSETEQAVFNSLTDGRAISFLSGRYAAKEAITKCLSGLECPDMRELVIYNDSMGRPCVSYKDYEIQLSISHEKKYSVAIAIMG